MELVPEEVAIGGLARESIVDELVVDATADQLDAMGMDLLLAAT